MSSDVYRSRSTSVLNGEFTRSAISGYGYCVEVDKDNKTRAAINTIGSTWVPIKLSDLPNYWITKVRNGHLRSLSVLGDIEKYPPQLPEVDKPTPTDFSPKKFKASVIDSKAPTPVSDTNAQAPMVQGSQLTIKHTSGSVCAVEHIPSFAKLMNFPKNKLYQLKKGTIEQYNGWSAVS